VLQGLVSHQNGAVSAAAMALILARGRRRDRFGQCLVAFDDLSPETADRLAHAIAAAMRQDMVAGHGAAAADAELPAAAAELLDRHDSGRSIEALSGALVALLDESGLLTDDLLLASAQEGEVAFLGEALGRRAGLVSSVALDALLSGDAVDVMALLRVAGCSRELSAGLLAIVGDLLGIDDPGAAIGLFDRMSPDEVRASARWLAAAPAYRAALDVLGRDHG
jgi:hypothetical protein